MRSTLAWPFLALLLAFVVAGPVRAEDPEPPVFRLLIKNHRFEPARLTVPPGIRLILMVRNGDDTPAEFESSALNVEKIISAGREATVRLGPLKPGEYPFMDDFHQSAKGVLVVSGP